MRQTRLTKWIGRVSGIISWLCLLNGCGSFAFYEDTKVAIAIKIDPKAPDPVEISAAYKESVFALVPVGRDNSNPESPILFVGPVLSDFDVRFGVNAGVRRDRNDNFLYVAITHGVATGRAATVLASRSIGSDQARRMVLIAFLRQLSETDIKTAAAALNLGGIGSADGVTLRRRSIEAVYSIPSSDLGQVENALEKTKFSVPFTPWKG